MEYKCVKFDEKSFNSMEVMAMSVFFKALKGGNFITVYYNFISSGQNVALVLLNKFVKFDEISLHFVKVVAEICWK